MAIDADGDAGFDLVCEHCGRRVVARWRARCDCGQPLWVDGDHTDADATLPDGPVADQWAFADLLPVEPPTDLGRAAGGTPLIRTPALDDGVGATVSVKYEGANPTGSFKDRGSAVAVAAATAAGADTVATVSHGNMARSVAAHAAAAGLDCTVFVPDDIPRERLGTIAAFDPDIVAVDGDYGALYERALALGPDRNVPVANSDVPLRVAGQKTTLLEVFAEATPDAVVLPVSSGGHASAAWKAVRDLRSLGALSEPPELHFVQTAACAPVAEAFARGDDTVSPVTAGETVAYSIANADPPSGDRALRAARTTGGAVRAVDDDAIERARDNLATRTGLSVETASATTLAAARRIAFDPGDEVVLVATGDGAVEAANRPPPATQSVDIDDVETVL
ncbi:MAG: pyridoxal-phosphate dependent enzyme [Halolamina sp.]